MNGRLTCASAVMLMAVGSADAQPVPTAPAGPGRRPRVEVAVGVDPFSRMGRGTAYAASAAATWALERYDNLRADLGVMGWWIRSSTLDYEYYPTHQGSTGRELSTDVLAVGGTAAASSRIHELLWASASVGLGYVPYATAGDHRSTGALAWLGLKFLVDDRFSVGITATGLTGSALRGEQYFPVMVGWTFR